MCGRSLTLCSGLGAGRPGKVPRNSSPPLGEPDGVAGRAGGGRQREVHDEVFALETPRHCRRHGPGFYGPLIASFGQGGQRLARTIGTVGQDA